jgi:hypothetical protein
VLLVEDLDALGADPTDARDHAAWLTGAGAEATWLAVAGSETGEPASPDDGPLAGRVVPRRRAGAALREAVARGSWDRLWLASPFAGGGPLARWLPGRAEWWPTGFAPPSAGLDPLAWLGRRALPPLAGDAAPASPSIPLLAWSAVTPPASRRTGLPLWDGDLVLAPEGLPGARGDDALQAFARVADAWSGVDLVGWSHPSPVLWRRACSLGVEMRVHHVGRPARAAEHAWWAHASAAVLTGVRPMTIGVVLRALEAGCPLLWVDPPAPADGLARRLFEAGCCWLAPSESDAIAAALDGLLERGPEVEEVVARGRALAALHDGAELTTRLAANLGTSLASARVAA